MKMVLCLKCLLTACAPRRAQVQGFALGGKCARSRAPDTRELWCPVFSNCGDREPGTGSWELPCGCVNAGTLVMVCPSFRSV